MSGNNECQPRRIAVFDATLRDGEQAPGNAMSPEDKLRYALESEAFGADVIEVGFPASSPADFVAAGLVANALTTARFSTFNRCSRQDIDASAAAAGIHPRHQVAVCGTGSDLHLEHKRGITREQARAEGRDAVGYAKSLGATDIAFCVEDASRADRDFVKALVCDAVEAGATTIGMADTTGSATPDEYASLFAAARRWLPADITLSTHCHDDLGLSLANALAAVLAGADEVQTTLAGIGERSGNTPLEEVAAVLAVKGDGLGLSTGIALDRLYDSYLRLAETIGLRTPRNKAVFGDNAFATQAGIHQHGILQNPATYELVDPARFGRRRRLLVGRHSGRAIVRHLLVDLGRADDDELVERLYQELVAARAGAECDELDALRARVAAELEAVTRS
ncbi:homocitrate synthase/isopropylmalate synthase family protein [Saccharothrix xinjiangensis]|uniref:2-isopropylmalate synthase n=1 Tax=Saccharothrix xinjiangensis TaxID=204798 RepID=A0ABV9Y2F7_9PSEU